MFDVSFSELLLIGVIALIVIGPERLPGVARTLGHLFGRAQRYVNDVKADIQREVDLGDINSFKEQITDAANSVKSSFENATDDLKKPLQDTQDAFKEASESVSSLVNEAKTSAQDAADSVKSATGAESSGSGPASTSAPLPDAIPAAETVAGDTASDMAHPQKPSSTTKPADIPEPSAEGQAVGTTAPEPKSAQHPTQSGTPT